MVLELCQDYLRTVPLPLWLEKYPGRQQNLSEGPVEGAGAAPRAPSATNFGFRDVQFQLFLFS